MLPPLEPCRVFVRDIHAATGVTLARKDWPARWEHNQYAVELWLQRALTSVHPWRTEVSSSADLVFASANFSMMCLAGKYVRTGRLWAAANKQGAFGPRPASGGAEPPVFVTSQYGGCPAPVLSVFKPLKIDHLPSRPTTK